MHQNISYLNYKLQQQEEEEQYTDNPSSTSRKFKVKQLLRRYRNQTSPQTVEEDHLKIKLLDSYGKLQIEITENQKLKEVIREGELRNQELEKQNLQLKKLLQKVIQNRKHLDKELEDSLKVNQGLRSEIGQRKLREQELESQNSLIKQNHTSLTQIIDNNTKQIQSLELIIKQRNLNISMLNENLKKSYIQSEKRSSVQESVTNRRVSKISQEKDEYKHYSQNLEPNISHNAINLEQAKPKIRQRQFKVGKWKKNTQSIEDQHIEEPPTSNQQTLVKTCSQSKIKSAEIFNDDELLTIQQNKKRSLDEELAKLMKIKKPGIQQNQRMEEVEAELYRTQSNISRLKRKIRNKY